MIESVYKKRDIKMAFGDYRRQGQMMKLSGKEALMGTDSLYYIMDYSSHYYRVNKADQLVVATSQEEAAVFTFKEANGRLGDGKKSSFYYMIPIEENEKTEISCDALDEFVTESETDTMTRQDESERILSPVKRLTYDELQDPIEKNVSSYDLVQMDWVEYLTHFTYMASGLQDYRDELAIKHSDIEQKICDILHYIELCEIDEEDAVDLIELLRVCRENRRKIKDELMRIEYFQTNFATSANVAKAKQALKSMKGLETRKYKPRKYEELFDNCVMKNQHRGKAGKDSSDKTVRNEKRRFSAVQTDYEGGSEDMTAEERRYTPYDEKENDWLAFARQQADFYNNVGQYIVNLQIAVREINQEIEDVLQEIEVANCNVAQGYKVFKRLKELRLDKKAKEQELNCLYALTDYIDCDILADACENSLVEIEDIMNVEEDNPSFSEQNIGSEEQQICVVESVRDLVV